MGLEHLLYAPTFVLTAKRKLQPIAEFFSGPEARRCGIGHINATKLCRKSLKGYMTIPIVFNERDRLVGGSGAAGPLPAPRGYSSLCEDELEW